MGQCVAILFPAVAASANDPVAANDDAAYGYFPIPGSFRCKAQGFIHVFCFFHFISPSF
jgi:hypothetical protein